MSTDSTELTTEMRNVLANNSLWEFALSLYACPGVEAACLRLQDNAGMDVCELLWSCWLEHHGLTLADDVEQRLSQVRAWQRDMTYPLRRQRRVLKAAVNATPELAQLRLTIKNAELLAEQEALRQLQQLAHQEQTIRQLQHSDAPWIIRIARNVQGDTGTLTNDLGILMEHLYRV